MLFNSLEFACFFLPVYLSYLFLKHRYQNWLLLAASCVFYGTWNWKLLFLMFFQISIDYFCALRIHSSSDKKTRKRFLIFSLTSNLCILGIFKYFNFFIGSFDNWLNLLGFNVHPLVFHIILPLGISFYTFEAMSYVYDVYRQEIEPIRDYAHYALFVIFFPHLIAGPIMRAKTFLPQITLPRVLTLEKFYEGCYLIFWGLFQKMFIADSLAKIVDPVFSSAPYSGATVLLAVYAFAFQIYGDFLGYSNIARGLGKCMGFDILFNFNLPYFSTNPREFWQRWHISLSTWLRDYLYITLGGNKNGKVAEYRNLAITMFLGGLWHGASWTFVFWGIYQGALLIIHRLLQPFLGRIALPFILRVIFFFQFICVGWLMFRAKSMAQAWQMAQSILVHFKISAQDIVTAEKMVFLLCILWAVETLQFIKSDLLAVLKLNPVIKAVFYVICFYLILFCGATGGKQFIYFQF